jgi:hypothetical protein
VAGDGADSVNAGNDENLVDGGRGTTRCSAAPVNTPSREALATTASMAAMETATRSSSPDPGWDYAITQSGGVHTIVDRDLSDGDEGANTVANVELIAFNGSAALGGAPRSGQGTEVPARSPLLPA